MAFCQKLSWRPHTSPASSGGIHAVRVVMIMGGERRRRRTLTFSRLWGSSATERTSNARLRAAHTAVNKFTARGMSSAGSQPNGYVSA